MPYENSKEEVDDIDQTDSEPRVGVKMNEKGELIIDTTDCYSWTCPN